MSLLIECGVFNPLQVNTYFLVDSSTHECVIVDPACHTLSEQQAVDKYLSSKGFALVALWFTHLHFDHVWGAAHILKSHPVPTYASFADLPVLAANARMTEAWGLPAPESFSITNPLSDGDKLSVGQYVFEVISTPGHTPGGLSFYCPSESLCLTGDTLFCGSVGRTDFEGGSLEALRVSVREKLFLLPPQTEVLPGHGPSTTIADELQRCVV